MTLSTWRKVGYDKDGDSDFDIDDIRLLKPDDAMMVLKKFYWDRWRADEINNQKVVKADKLDNLIQKIPWIIAGLISTILLLGLIVLKFKR